MKADHSELTERVARRCLDRIFEQMERHLSADTMSALRRVYSDDFFKAFAHDEIEEDIRRHCLAFTADHFGDMGDKITPTIPKLLRVAADQLEIEAAKAAVQP